MPPTQLIVGPSTVSYTVGNNSYVCGWGAIRELRPSKAVDRFVKGVDSGKQKWSRTVLVNQTHVVVMFKAVVKEGVWVNDPITVYLIVTFFREGGLLTNQNNSNPFDWQNQPSLKFSLEIMGNWSFEAKRNRLHVEFYIGNQFHDDNCGNSYQQVDAQSAKTAVYELFGANNSRTRVSLLEYGYGDGQLQPVQVLPPSLSNGTAQFELVFLPFVASLAYDPSFAILLGLGDSGSGCQDSLLQWILPVAFLAGAAAVILAAIVLGSTPWCRPYVLGPEGHRVHVLRSNMSFSSVNIPELPTTSSASSFSLSSASSPLPMNSPSAPSFIEW